MTGAFIMATAVALTFWTLATSAVKADAAPAAHRSARAGRFGWFPYWFPAGATCTPREAAKLGATPARCVNLDGTHITVVFAPGQDRDSGIQIRRTS
jgi:hypothetical protein